jgi:hypothetical protein
LTSTSSIAAVLPSAYEFQEDRVEAVHVGTVGDGRVGEPLGREVPARAPHHGEQARLLRGEELGQPEVRDLHQSAVREQDVLRLDVAVDDPLVAPEVEVREAPRRSDGHVHRLLPLQQRRRARGSKQGRIQGPAVHVLVHEQAALALGAEAAEADQVHVVDVADDSDLGAELAPALRPDTLDLLHGHQRAVGQLRLLHGAISTRKPLVMHVLHLLVREPGREARDHDVVAAAVLDLANQVRRVGRQAVAPELQVPVPGARGPPLFLAP